LVSVITDPYWSLWLTLNLFFSLLVLLLLCFFRFFFLFFRLSKLFLLNPFFPCFPVCLTAVHGHTEYRGGKDKEYQSAQDHRIDIPPCFSPLVIVHPLSPHWYP